MKLEFGTIVTCDLKKNTIVLEMDEPISIKPAQYAVIKLESLNDRIAVEEFIANLNK